MKENNELTTPRDQRIEEWAALGALDALDALEKEQLSRCLHCPVSPMPDAIAKNEMAVCAIGLGNAPSSEGPSPDVKEKLLTAVASRAKEVDQPPKSEIQTDRGFSYSLAKEAEWTNLPLKGVRMRKLTEDKNSPFVSIIIEMDSGAVLPAHGHKEAEEAYLISGDLEGDGVQFVPGDYIFVNRGQKHSAFHSPSGCRAIIITARENYPARTLSVYHRATSIGRWLKNRLSGNN